MSNLNNGYIIFRGDSFEFSDLGSVKQISVKEKSVYLLTDRFSIIIPEDKIKTSNFNYIINGDIQFPNIVEVGGSFRSSSPKTVNVNLDLNIATGVISGTVDTSQVSGDFNKEDNNFPSSFLGKYSKTYPDGTTITYTVNNDFSIVEESVSGIFVYKLGEKIGKNKYSTILDIDKSLSYIDSMQPEQVNILIASIALEKNSLKQNGTITFNHFGDNTITMADADSPYSYNMSTPTDPNDIKKVISDPKSIYSLDYEKKYSTVIIQQYTITEDLLKNEYTLKK